jgi:small conductance mechanosensitive channel
LKDLIFSFWQSNSSLILDVFYKLILTVVTLAAGNITVKLVKKILKKPKKPDETLIPVVSTIISYSIYALCIVIILDLFGVNTASIITLLGAAGLAIGFALKDTLANIASGIMLLILRPFNKDDYIEFGSTAGTVIEIGLFTTILKTPDGLFISAPNTSLWGVPLLNYTKNGTRRLAIVVRISYSDSIEIAYNVMREIIKNEKRFLLDPEPQIMVHSLSDSSVNVQLRAWTTADDFWDVTWEQNRNVKEKIEAAGLTIPFPQQDIHIKKGELQ